MKKLTIIFVLIIIGGLAIYAYLEYNRKPANLINKKANLFIAANNLLQDFSVDENAANKKYLGKIIDVSGVVSASNQANDSTFNIILGNNADGNNVSCLMNIENIMEAKKQQIGDSIVVRGNCTGYLMDVELNQCVIIYGKK
jgi:hypothetical protein